ncbi:UNVERIFIED_CONTAM: hypothetical protein GTU68_005765, partial [Idotea baltica]|nr:hypothetical protein [Idotea baltica]
MATQKLAASGIECPGFDARLLLAGAMNVEMAQLISMGSENISAEVSTRVSNMIAERTAGKPVHRILGYREFFGRRFNLGPHSLEPRPETELLVERILEDFKRADEVSFLEIGVGSGAIIVSLLCEMPHSHGCGVDISRDALKDAASNSRLYNVLEYATFVQSDCFDGISGKFDFIVSNP